jgi:hypothetical protein
VLLRALAFVIVTPVVLVLVAMLPLRVDVLVRKDDPPAF